MKPASNCHPADVTIIPNELQEKHACPPVQPNAEMVVRWNLCGVTATP
jgi:hypothetical protein